ncbi:hypothetical protein Taro_022664, partial [Colocasia esculenta]|nr:hypothetical protein [Colocasia esculenta]
SLIWVHQHRLYSHPVRIILTPSAKELAITFCPGIGIAYVDTIRNRHSEMVDKMLVLHNSVPGPKFHREACVPVHRLSYPLETLIVPLSPQAIRRRFGVEKPSILNPKLRFRRTILPFPRFSRCNISVDHVNPGRGNHTVSACHGDRKLCSTRRENSSPGDKTSFRGRKTFVSHSKIAIPADDLPISKNRHSKTVDRTLVLRNSVTRPEFHRGACNRHSETVDRMLVLRNSVSGPKFHRGACILVIRRRFGVEKPSFRTPKLQFRQIISPFPRFSRRNISLNHVNPRRGNHTESTCHGDRKLCSTLCENSSPGR